MVVHVEIKNIVIGMPTSNKDVDYAQNALAIRSDISVGFA